MGSLETKLVVADALMSLSRVKPLRKISVSDIVAEVQMNRKTFYYHFTDKNHLVAWIFRYDIGQLLEERVSPEHLMYLRDGDKSCEPFPYYTFIKEGVRSIDGSYFVCAFIDALESRRSFYAQALSDGSPNGLPAYLRSIYIPALLSDTAFILSNRFLGKEHQEFLATYHFEALLGYLTNRLNAETQDAIDGFGPFNNIMHASIADAIERHQHQRAAEHTQR